MAAVTGYHSHDYITLYKTLPKQTGAKDFHLLALKPAVMLREGILGGSHGKELEITSKSSELPPAKTASKKTMISALQLQGDEFCQPPGMA